MIVLIKEEIDINIMRIILLNLKFFYLISKEVKNKLLAK